MAVPAVVALVQTAVALPVLLGVPAGALADLVDRRLLLVATQGLMLAAAAVLAVLTWTGTVTPAAVLALTFALGVGTTLNAPAWQAVQPELVPAAEFPQAVTLGGASMNLGRAMNLTVTAGATAVGSAAWGAVANVLGISGAFSWGNLAVALTLLAGVRWRFSSIASYDLSPAPLAEPDTPLTVPTDGGPVYVTVTYQVQPGAETTPP